MGYLSTIFNKFYEKRDVDIINEFRERIWNTLPYQKLNRKYTYKITNSIDDLELLNKLNEFKTIEYKVLKSRYKKDELVSEEYIKARINSNYAKYFDKEVYLGKQYYYQLANYKNIYFRYINRQCEDVISEINLNTLEANRLLEESVNKKIDLTWKEYKELVNGIIPKVFDNYIPMDKKIEEGKWKPNHNYEWDEDNYIIRYFNKSLDGYIKNYIKSSKKPKLKKCGICCVEINPKSKNKYCKACAKEINKIKTKNNMKKLRESRGLYISD